MEKAKENRRILIGGIVLLLGYILLMPSCSKVSVGDCFTGTGDIEKSERNIDYFHAISLKDNINLHLIPSTRNRLVLEAGSKLKPKIITEVNADSVLVIQNDNRCNWVRSYDKPINVYLEFIDLKLIEYRSIGDVTNEDTLHLDSLQIDVYEGAGKIDLTLITQQCTANLSSGTADVFLHGESGIGFYFQLGAGQIDASEMKVRLAYLRNWSSNNMRIWVTNDMSVEIKGLGNVYYLGNPSFSSSILGEGKLIKVE